MSWHVRVEPNARREARTGLAFYASRDPKLATRLSRTFERVLKEIGENPYRWAEVHDGIREAIVGGWPCAIYYRLDDEAVSVFSIFNTNRDPQEWVDRI